MAEIPVERKSGGKAWLWLLVIVVLALLAWLFFGRDDNPEPATVGATPVTTPATTPAPGAAPASVPTRWNVTLAA